MRFDFTLGPSGDSRRRSRDEMRRVLVLSDLRGNGVRSTDLVLDRPIVKVDVDNLDDVLARYAPVIQLGTAAGGERLEIRRFDDFHPDSLVEALSVFRRLRDVRARLDNPRTFSSAVAELHAHAPVPSSPAVSPAAAQATEPPDGSTIDRLLGRTATPPVAEAPAVVAPQASDSAVDALIRQAIAPHIVPAPSPQLPQMLSAVDAGMTDLMRAVLHDPAFQDVEAAWRAVQWLISTLDLGETLELRLLHVTRDELAEATSESGDLRRRLVERESRSDGAADLSAVIGNYAFGPSAYDVAVLEQLGSLAAALGAPFIGGASAGLLGATTPASQRDPREWTPLPGDDEARWQKLRGRAASGHLGLAWPRFLLRLPYGKRSDPIAAFAFEEQPARPEHESFLWGNAAFAYAVAVSRALDPDGDPSSATAIDGLPAFVFSTDDGMALQPLAESNLSDAAVLAVQARGLMPVISLKDRDAIRLVPPQSIANPPTGLLD